jgi:hypothetical protein
LSLSGRKSPHNKGQAGGRVADAPGSDPEHGRRGPQSGHPGQGTAAGASFAAVGVVCLDASTVANIAGATFALAAGNTNPQGIAYPQPPDMLVTSAPAPALLEVPSVAAFTLAPSSGLSAVAAIPSLASQDAAFAMLVWESPPRPAEPALDLTAPLDRPAPVADPALTFAAVTGGQQPRDLFSPLTRESGQGFRSERSAVGLRDGALIDKESQGAAMVTDSFFALLAANAAEE